MRSLRADPSLDPATDSAVEADESLARDLFESTLQRTALVMTGLVGTLAAALMAYHLTRAAWAICWVIADVGLVALRIVILKRARSRIAAGVPWPPIQRLLLIAGFSWTVLLGAGTTACILTGRPVLLGFGLLLCSGTVCGVPTRNAGTPRYALCVIATVTLGPVIALAVSPIPDLKPLAAILVLLSAGMGFALGQNRQILIQNHTGKRAALQLANVDSLTGLVSRSCFLSRLAAICQPDYAGRCFSLLGIDLDGFKAINDQYGHAGGDLLLQVVANRIRATIRPLDVAGRQGGDEFVILLEADSEEAGHIAHRLLASITQPIDLGLDQVVSISASIGGMTTRLGMATPETCLIAADEAMYAAKAAGKNTYRAHHNLTPPTTKGSELSD